MFFLYTDSIDFLFFRVDFFSGVSENRLKAEHLHLFIFKEDNGSNSPQHYIRRTATKCAIINSLELNTNFISFKEALMESYAKSKYDLEILIGAEGIKQAIQAMFDQDRCGFWPFFQ